MKTQNYLKAKSIKTYLILATAFVLAGNSTSFAQETNSVFGTDSRNGFVWGMDLKTSSIQNELGTLYGMYAGALYGHSALIAFTGALNVSHPTVNYGYIGLMVQYTFKPDNLIHMSGQLVFGAGTAIDYEQAKSSTFDNFGNVNGTGFYFIEPGLNGEINLGIKTRLVLGIGYRLVNGIDRDSKHVSRTHVSDKDMSGICISAGIKLGLY